MDLYVHNCTTLFAKRVGVPHSKNRKKQFSNLDHGLTFYQDHFTALIPLFLFLY